MVRFLVVFVWLIFTQICVGFVWVLWLVLAIKNMYNRFIRTSGRVMEEAGADANEDL